MSASPFDPQDAAIVFDDVYKSFGAHKVLMGLDLVVPKGKCTVIIGRSGTGKSVMLKHAMGLIQPDAGRVVVLGKELGKLKREELQRLRLRFGMVFQNAALFDSLSVYENVAFPLREHEKLSEAETLSRVEAVLAQVGLSFAIQKMPSELSGGMRKRVGLARAIIHTPDILLYDEPTTGLDPILTAQIDQLIAETQQNHPGMASVVVSHDMKGAFMVADYIYMLHQGKVVAQGVPEHFKTTDDPLVRQFVEGRLDGPIGVE